MNTCKTCKHWGYDENREWDNIVNPVDSDSGEPCEMPFVVKRCMNPSLHFCERPTEKDGFGVADASMYQAKFYTAEDFGCVKHEATA